MRVFTETLWGGPGTLADRLLEMGHWPKRDVKYDTPSPIAV